jgi:hypothetical protein
MGTVAAAVAGTAVLLQTPAGPKHVTVAWMLEATPLSNSLVSFVQSRTNLSAGAWVERTNFPYHAGSNGVVFLADKRQELFRAGWRFK